MPASASTLETKKPRFPLWLGIVVCALFWGSAFPVIKLVFMHWEEQGVEIDFSLRSFFAGLRFFIAGLALLLIAKSPWQEWKATPLRLIIAMALTQTVGQYVCFYLGLALSSAALASLLISGGSFWLVLLGPRFGYSAPLNGRQWLILCIGALGVTLAVYSPGVPAANPQLGGALILAAGFFSALGLIYFQKIKPTMGAKAGTGFSLGLGGVILLLLGANSLTRGDLAHFDGFVWLCTVWLAFVSAAAFALYNYLSTLMPAHRLATQRFLIPVCGVFESLLLIPGERLTLAMLAGGAIVVVAMVLVQRR